MPALEQAHPAAQVNVAALAEILAAEAEVLDELVDSVLGGREEVALAVLRAQPPALQRLIVQRLADTAAGEPAAGVARRAADVAALPDTGHRIGRPSASRSGHRQPGHRALHADATASPRPGHLDSDA